MVTITADQTTVTEGDTVIFTLTRTSPTTKAVVVNVSVSDPGSFLRGNHWQPNPVLPTEAIFEVESSTTTISLQTKDDLRDIPDNNLTVTVNSGIGYSTASDADSASIAVTDNDVAPTLHLSIDSDSVEEGETLTITLQITGGSQNPVEFAVVRGYEGEPDRGYTGLNGSETAISWNVDTDDNDLDEEDGCTGWKSSRPSRFPRELSPSTGRSMARAACLLRCGTMTCPWSGLNRRRPHTWNTASAGSGSTGWAARTTTWRS